MHVESMSIREMTVALVCTPMYIISVPMRYLGYALTPGMPLFLRITASLIYLTEPFISCFTKKYLTHPFLKVTNTQPEVLDTN